MSEVREGQESCILLQFDWQCSAACPICQARLDEVAVDGMVSAAAQQILAAGPGRFGQHVALRGAETFTPEWDLGFRLASTVRDSGRAAVCQTRLGWLPTTSAEELGSYMERLSSIGMRRLVVSLDAPHANLITVEAARSFWMLCREWKMSVIIWGRRSMTREDWSRLLTEESRPVAREVHFYG